jgi:hypothetical protein
MHTRFLLSLTIVVAVSASGCGEQEKEETAIALKRDLTLVAPAPNLEIASPVEVKRPQPQVTRARAPRRHVSAPKSITLDVDLEPIRPAVAAQPSLRPAVTAPEPVNGRELPPGKTVTLIPASSGPSTAADPSVDEGLLMIQQGHYCPPPRPGIGIRRPPALY